jgi:hypothetical protein
MSESLNRLVSARNSGGNMRKRLFIGALMGAIPAVLLIILIFGRESWEVRTAWVVFMLCILPASIAGLLGAAWSENKRQASNNEINSKVKEPIGENKNLQENANDQKDSEIGESVKGGIIGGIVFIVVCFILFLMWYQVVIVAGGRPIPTPIGATPMPPRTVSWEAVDADAPSTVVVGENMRINARFTNLGKISVESITVQISQDYFEGFVLESSTPQYNETHQYKGFMETLQSFVFNISVPPGETYTIEFNGKAILKGNYHVSIFICAGGDWDCAGTDLRPIKIE